MGRSLTKAECLLEMERLYLQRAYSDCVAPIRKKCAGESVKRGWRTLLGSVGRKG